MTISPARIAVHDVNQLLNSMFTISHNHCWSPFGCSDVFVIDHQQTVVITGNKFFCDHATGNLFRQMQCLYSLLPGCNVDGGAAAMISADRLEHERVPDFLHCSCQILFVVYNSSTRNW